jgi:hypothetical protein
MYIKSRENQASPPDNSADRGARVDRVFPRSQDQPNRCPHRQESRPPRSFFCKFLITPQARLQIEADARGSSGSMVKVSQGHIKNWLIPVPPKLKQEETIKYLDEKTAGIDRQKAKVKEAIELLKEYRTALMTNAITGKIDVRQVARV